MGPEQEDKVKMVVAGITLDQSNNMPIIILRGEEEEVAIPIWIGLIEASAIATELEGIALPRPMTHDLLKNVLETMGGRVLRVEVSDLRENTFYAVLYIEQGGAVHQIDARPSDSIALALRTSAPIFVSRQVLDKSQHVDMEMLKQALGEGPDGEGKSDKDRWTEILENLKPEDFGKYKM
ncbi:MAG: bifunctional nuclease family protein [Deltaproteobacteria bacterium]|nr:MAG: bifunctional nuclease family protein [Deltaproteobacteria bacterium]